jgi:hypothetical protein
LDFTERMLSSGGHQEGATFREDLHDPP